MQPHKKINASEAACRSVSGGPPLAFGRMPGTEKRATRRETFRLHSPRAAAILKAENLLGGLAL